MTPDIHVAAHATRLLLPHYFFLQAEDGIRDLYVTGVQTCALPIWTAAISSHRWAGTAIWRSLSRILVDRHGGDPMTDPAEFTVADLRSRAGDEAFRAAWEHVVAIDGPDEDEWSLYATIELDDGRTLETILHH